MGSFKISLPIFFRFHEGLVEWLLGHDERIQMSLEILLEEARKIVLSLGDDLEELEDIILNRDEGEVENPQDIYVGGTELRMKLVYYLGLKRVSEFIRTEIIKHNEKQKHLLLEIIERIEREGLNDDVLGFPVLNPKTQQHGVIVEISESLYGGAYFYRVDMGTHTEWVEGLIGYEGRRYEEGEPDSLFTPLKFWSIGEKVSHKIRNQQGLVVGHPISLGRVLLFPVLWDGAHKEMLELAGHLV